MRLWALPRQYIVHTSHRRPHVPQTCVTRSSKILGRTQVVNIGAHIAPKVCLRLHMLQKVEKEHLEPLGVVDVASVARAPDRWTLSEAR